MAKKRTQIAVRHVAWFVGMCAFLCAGPTGAATRAEVVRAEGPVSQSRPLVLDLAPPAVDCVQSIVLEVLNIG